MQSTEKGTTSTSRKNAFEPNAFEPDFLRDLAQRGEVSTAPDAEMQGPWKVSPMPGKRFGVFRDWEDPGEGGNGAAEGDVAQGDVPEAVFEHREHALLAAAVLPSTGREPLFDLDSEREPEGYAIDSVWGDRWVTTVGRLRCFHPDVVEALHVVESVVRSPVALANLLEAAGPSALELAGRILRRRLEEAREE